MSKIIMAATPVGVPSNFGISNLNRSGAWRGKSLHPELQVYPHPKAQPAAREKRASTTRE